MVTGGAGFIGSQIVDAYLEKGHQVAILDSLVTGLRRNINPKAKFYEADLRDQVKVEQAVAEFKPEVINHHAAHLSVSESVEKPQFTAEVNSIGFLNVMEAGRKNGLKRVIVASTGGALYGDTDQVPTTEDHPTEPVSPYGVTKLAMEEYLHYYKVQYGVNWVALRYANVYGPRQNPKGETGVVAVFLEKINSGQGPVVFGDGLQTRDYVFVEDVVDANVAAVEQGSGPYNIGTGIETNVIEIFNQLQALMNSDFPEIHNEARPGEQRRSALDASKARTELGWQSQVNFTTGLEATVSRFKSYKEGNEDNRD